MEEEKLPIEELVKVGFKEVTVTLKDGRVFDLPPEPTEKFFKFIMNYLKGKKLEEVL